MSERKMEVIEKLNGIADPSCLNPYGLKVGNQAEIAVCDNILDVCLMYPTQNEINMIELDVCAVRVTNPVRITYDFERNGWSILQQTSFDEDIGESQWSEKAFLPYMEQ